ncbi:MAG: hypothetical protein KF892_23790 [Rhizobacter sp.]|nr:hypothetical protein [Rhizobacter sp.]
MTERYFAMRYQASFPSREEAQAEIERDFSARDATRPPEKRFELELLRKAQWSSTAEGHEMLIAGEAVCLLAKLRSGSLALFQGSTGMAYENLEEASSWVGEYGAIGAGGEWAVFKA